MLKSGLIFAFLLALGFALVAPWADSQEAGAIPAYNAGPPPKGKKLPPILSPQDLWGDDGRYSFQTRAYELAAKIPVVLHQQPCYCYCDRMGHNSLHSCFEGRHGAQCDICLKELYYAYSQTQSGKTARQIRQGIIRGDWRAVDVQSAAASN